MLTFDFNCLSHLIGGVFNVRKSRQILPLVCEISMTVLFDL